MRVLLAGASGFLGSHLAPRLRARGHELRTLGRGTGADHDWSPRSLEQGVAWCEAIVSLAGENLFARRWDPAFKQLLWASRYETTRDLARLAARHGTRALIGSSAVGYYGPHGDEELDESSPAGNDFAARMCVDWEEAQRPAAEGGVRCVALRTGLVLGLGGGALGRMLPIFRLGLGGPLGHGRQWVPWIHLDDWIGLLAWLLERADARGAYNASAPEPVTMREFARALGRAVHRPAILPVPAFAMRARFGEGAGVLLAGQRVLPARAQAEGFRFAHPRLDEALADLMRAGGA